MPFFAAEPVPRQDRFSCNRRAFRRYGTRLKSRSTVDPGLVRAAPRCGAAAAGGLGGGDRLVRVVFGGARLCHRKGSPRVVDCGEVGRRQVCDRLAAVPATSGCCWRGRGRARQPRACPEAQLPALPGTSVVAGPTADPRTAPGCRWGKCCPGPRRPRWPFCGREKTGASSTAMPSKSSWLLGVSPPPAWCWRPGRQQALTPAAVRGRSPSTLSFSPKPVPCWLSQMPLRQSVRQLDHR